MQTRDKNRSGISIVLTTRNRAEILQQTLKAFVQLNDPGVSWELVLVDNDSSDETGQVARSFDTKLPLVYVFEKEPGKCHALNTGITAASYDLILFTDDDITPCLGWLQAYARAAEAYLECSYFGGPIALKLPSTVPSWAKERNSDRLLPWIAGNLSQLDLNGVPPEKHSFYGGNMGYRRHVFDVYGMFDPHIGHIGQRVMGGEETYFQKRLKAGGERPCYVPDALVWHRIKPEELTLQYHLRRNFWMAYGWAQVDHWERPAIESRWRICARTAKHTLQHVYKGARSLVAGDRPEALSQLFRIARAWGWSAQRLQVRNPERDHD